MGFVLSGGAVRGLSRPTYRTPQRIMLSQSYSADYAELWRTQPAVRTVVSFLARNIAQLGLPLYRRDGDTDRTRMQDHPLAVMLRKPNPWTTRYRMINALVHDFAIYDNAYWLKSKVEGGDQPIGLVRIPPTLIKPAGENWLTPDEFVITGSKGKKTVGADEVVYFRGYGLDEDAGVSPLESLRQILREEFVGSQMREQVMRNGARLSGYIQRPPKNESGDWSDKAKERFRQQWQAQYVGEGPQAGGTPILEDGMSFHAASQTAKDLQYIEGRKLTREEVATAYHIPPPMVGILDHATFSNIREQHKMLYQDTLGPWLVMFEEEIELQLLPDFEAKPTSFYVEFNLREKLTGDLIERGAVIQQAVGGPWMTVNEARALDNRAPVDGGDELIRPLNVTQNGDDEPIPADDGQGGGMESTNDDEPPADDDEQED
ncbi:phage portal protein [Mycolicibacterium sp. F2034L]|uniref:phage portal protein n=1 Tax=Mycolicibacterium sp. F2034L TaxID=2926422 RepID=UPI001FF6633F|nr:phage portal protein [Mycolicibacterium sp. F2034L]MCK0174796.1 phage portal protein [Mycolicibacterium sp. F2034L]